MKDWLITHLSERERLMYRIAMRSAKDQIEVDECFYLNFVANVELEKNLEKKCDDQDLP